MIKHELKSSTLYLCTHLFTKSQLTIKSTKILFVCASVEENAVKQIHSAFK